jgi:hypothetical protein
MSTETGAVDWAAALAEIEAEIAKLQGTAEVIRDRMAKAGIAPSAGGPGGGGGGIRPNTFLKMSILKRRSAQVGDIINMKGDWALTEWYPNHRPKAKGAAKEAATDAKESEKKATA